MNSPRVLRLVQIGWSPNLLSARFSASDAMDVAAKSSVKNEKFIERLINLPLWWISVRYDQNYTYERYKVIIKPYRYALRSYHCRR